MTNPPEPEATPPDDVPEVATDLDFKQEWEEASEDLSTRDRVFITVSGLAEPTTVKTIADRSDCSKGGARSTLEFLSELSVVEKVNSDPDLYQRNDHYFTFRRIDQLRQTKTTNELIHYIDRIEERDRELSEWFGAESPANVSAGSADADDIETYVDNLRSWQLVRRRREEAKRAITMTADRDARDGATTTPRPRDVTGTAESRSGNEIDSLVSAFRSLGEPLGTDWSDLVDEPVVEENE